MITKNRENRRRLSLGTTHPPCVGCDDPSSPCSCRMPTLRVGQATASRQGGAAVGAVRRTPAISGPRPLTYHTGRRHRGSAASRGYAAMAKDRRFCRDCQMSPIEYSISPTGLAVNHGLCRNCYERSVRLAVRDKSQETVTKRRRTRGSGYTGGTGYTAIR
jgi:hypothetical protein